MPGPVLFLMKLCCLDDVCGFEAVGGLSIKKRWINNPPLISHLVVIATGLILRIS
jgi:hypothetical protein